MKSKNKINKINHHVGATAGRPYTPKHENINCIFTVKQQALKL